MIESEIKIERNVLKELGEKKFIPALKRAQAYLRGAAKRKIRRRKKGHSKPGQPPFAHSKTFKQSIQFQVNKKDLEQYVGPERIIAYSLNPDKKPVPATLEKGGIVRSFERSRRSLSHLRADFDGRGRLYGGSRSCKQLSCRSQETRRRYGA